MKDHTQTIATAVFNIESILYLQGSSLSPEAYKVLVATVNNLKSTYSNS